LVVYRRKIQLTGGSTFIVSLPKEWASSMGLRPGSEVEIEPRPDGSLVLRVSPSTRSRGLERRKAIRVTADGMKTLATEILSAYLAGYNIIDLLYGADVDPRNLMREVERARERALGLEVIEEEYGRITLSTVTGPPTISSIKAFERMISITKSMLENVAQNMRKPDPVVLESVIERDTIVDKFFLLVMRQFTLLLQGGIRPSDAGIVVLPEILYRVIAAKSVERIADHSVLVAEILLNTRREAFLSDDIVELFEYSVEIFKRASRAYMQLDRNTALEARRMVDLFWRREAETRSALRETVYLPDAAALLDSTRRIAAYSSDLAEAALNIVELRSLNSDLL